MSTIWKIATFSMLLNDTTSQVSPRLEPTTSRLIGHHIPLGQMPFYVYYICIEAQYFLAQICRWKGNIPTWVKWQLRLFQAQKTCFIMTYSKQ